MGAIYKKILLNLFLLFISAGVFLSCGIDEYYYLNPVQSGDIQLTLQERAVIHLPGVSASYFTHFTIFYRIYISDYSAPGTIQTSSAVLSSINSTLASDYAAIEPSTSITSTTSNTTNTSSLFRNRNYQILNYEGHDVISSQNTSLILDFPIGSNPSVTVNGNTWNLYRSTGNGSFTPVPNRYFRNTDELNSSANAISTVNGDVVNKSSLSGKRYTYTAMYIVVTGLDQQSYTPIYSIPAFIGIFRLPD
ncbi:hypothetical protein FACS1894109_05540 [Spirochaetia bacterium]|nr:hypothetical protein FACS1894109_05540 [Spirochaetia bacterium]